MRTKDDATHLDPLGGPVRAWFAAAFARSDRRAAARVARDRRGRAHAARLAYRHRQDPRRVPRDPRHALSRARGRLARARAPVRLRLAPAEPRLRHRAEPGRADRGDSQAPGTRREPCPRRRPDRRHLGLPASEAPRRPAAPAHHDAREPVADAQPVGVGPGMEGRDAPGHRRGPRACPEQARSRPRRLSRTSRRDGLGRPRPHRPLGHLPAGRAGRAVSRRARAVVPDSRSTINFDRAADRRRIPHQVRRGAISRPDLPPAPPPARSGDGEESDDDHLRKYPRVRRETDARPPRPARPGHDRRAPLGARRRAAPGRRGETQGRRAPGRRHEHEPGAGRRHRPGRPLGPGRPARQRGRDASSASAARGTGRARRPAASWSPHRLPS